MNALFFGTFLTGALFSLAAHADPAGAPGIAHRWDSALKQAVGAAYEKSGASSPVWFTLSQGILTEVFYPSPDQAQIGDLQFLVTDGDSFFSEQKSDVVSEVSYADEGMTVLVSGIEKQGRYSFEQEIITDPEEPVVRIRTAFHWNQPGLRLFVLFKPAINNLGAQNLASATPEGLFATNNLSSSDLGQARNQETWAALIPSVPFSTVSSGYVGYSDGLQDISKNYHITQLEREAGPGNVSMTGEVPVANAEDFTFEMALGFGTHQSEAQAFAQTSLRVPFGSVRESYENGWRSYLNELQKNVADKRFFSESTFVRRSAQIIKMHEDKQNRGAIVASLSTPAIPASDNALDGSGGYHLIWPRAVYHAAMGLLASGDFTTSVDSLHYLEAHQKPDGSWAQNFWIDGTPYWNGLEMDEVGFPILLASQLTIRGGYSLQNGDLEMIRRAATFIASHGPATQEDRWEELAGYSPNTIAIEIAALREASTLIQDPSFGVVASHWQAMLERWTLALNGKWGKNYYIRNSPNGEPEDSPTNNLDGGFLDLVRYGVRDAHDPRILSTLQIYDDPVSGLAISNERGFGANYRRYTGDAYGEKGVAGLWPVLAGERGHYALLSGDINRARAELYLVEKSASNTGLLPEQTLSAPSNAISVGLGVARPLVWAHAEDILLHRSLEENNVFDAPQSGP